MALIGWIGLGAALLYSVMLFYLWAFQRGMIYRPDPTRPDPAQFSAHPVAEVSIRTADGLELLAWWHPPKMQDDPVILYLHGNAGHIGYRAEKAASYMANGYGVLILAWRGYSGNPGRPSEEGLYEDGAAALRWLQSEGIANERIVLYGESLGSGVAVELATANKTLAVILETPFSSLAETAQAHYPFFPALWLVRDRYDSHGKIGAVESPVLIGHGERDYIIPFRFAEKLFGAANEPKKFLRYPDAGHTNLPEFGWDAEVIEFIENYSDR